jgi:hypothetical protein
MVSFRGVLVTAVVSLMVAGCAENASSLTAPDGADFNTDPMFGGNNRADSTTTTTANSGTAEIPTDTTGRGGVFVGSGH